MSTYKESYLVYCSRKIHVLVYLYIIIGLDNFNQRVEILHKKHQISSHSQAYAILILFVHGQGHVTAVFNITARSIVLLF